jgi:cupin 2 domain-containing protein
MNKAGEKNSADNILSGIPEVLPQELEQFLLEHEHVSIRRILSKGHSAPAQGWYEQQDNEWVLVVKGEGILEFADNSERHMHEGDYCFIPALKKHRVKWTAQQEVTIWLAIHFPVQQLLQEMTPDEEEQR